MATRARAVRADNPPLGQRDAMGGAAGAPTIVGTVRQCDPLSPEAALQSAADGAGAILPDHARMAVKTNIYEQVKDPTLRPVHIASERISGSRLVLERTPTTCRGAMAK